MQDKMMNSPIPSLAAELMFLRAIFGLFLEKCQVGVEKLSKKDNTRNTVEKLNFLTGIDLVRQNYRDQVLFFILFQLFGFSKQLESKNFSATWQLEQKSLTCFRNKFNPTSSNVLK